MNKLSKFSWGRYFQYYLTGEREKQDFVEGSMSSNYHNTVFLLQIVFASSPLACNFNEQEVVV